ncbi:ANTAR domain-containing response regulator [uncultured Robinsoniella sp.]|uniref:ANTAR domain-containing response regulator n=1 Tax=uncultured Robinsoniella sp. TaxID=904190 RepID=UPI00374ED05E
MDSVLIISPTEKSIAVFRDMLSQSSCRELVTVANCGEARRLLIERSFDLCIINSPLRDETGVSLARNIATEGSTQVILIVKTELYDDVSMKVEEYGVFTIAKPISKVLFWSALKLCQASHNRMSVMRNENKQLLQKIEDIRIVDRAKCILIEYLNMSESEAHKYIEKQAMDTRVTRRIIADRILKSYENS